jgi:hypothetical protein
MSQLIDASKKRFVKGIIAGKLDTALTKAISVELEDVRWCIDFVVEFMLRAEERKRSARSNQLIR